MAATTLHDADWTRPLKVAEQLIVSATKENFAGQHAPDGTPWTPLKYERSRARDKRARKKGGRQQVLRDTGILMASVTASGRGHVRELSRTQLRVGTNLNYAGTHQFGHTFNRPARQRSKPWVFTLPTGQTVFTRRIRAYSFTVPARPFLGYSQALLGRIESVFRSHLARQVRL